ncbi:YidC/Oxa1 family membrane protein insertase [Litorivivens lipolytica]|uniref:Membrane protein insertase YidC n=1 Tax=Litorivivens lipolytica TaxID=1524264 RepID=A0A7W4Z853_9GAMM|nr:membrane protein insertase YidC [Litorivivens lipolytica]MBB3048680.1 YidC/Oxa1 family membrane protein insertase [Litorivivens lipolytica]
MDIQRTLLIAAIAVLSFMLVVEWAAFRQQEPAAVSAQAEQTTAPINATNGNATSLEDIPEVSPATEEAELSSGHSSDTVSVSTDVLQLTIDLAGGDIVYAALPEHYAEIDTPDEPFVILEQNRQREYIAQSGLIGKNGTDTRDGRPTFVTDHASYTLSEGQDELTVTLAYGQSREVTIYKHYRFNRGSYVVELDYEIDNRSDTDWQGVLFTQLKRDNSQDPSSQNNGMMGMQPFLGVAYRTTEERFEKLAFDKMRDKPLKLEMQGGWIAMLQHYFLSAWIPPADQQNYFSTSVTRSGDNIARYTSAAQTVAPKSSGHLTAQLYVGPKDQYALEEISEGLELSVDYGWLWWIAQPLFWLLTQIHKLVGNWGLAIIGVTLLVKIIFFQLNATAFRSMANMRRVQPKLLEIRERHSDDRAKQSQAMMELYKKEKINPLGGCLPILVQMPVFIALYWVLMESVELRHAPFFGWINDLSAMDPYFILPIIMGASMFIQQKLNPPPPDPMQAKIMQWLPVIFTFFFLFFPAGLVLYWVVNNLLSIAQQYIITRSIEKNAAKS